MTWRGVEIVVAARRRAGEGPRIGGILRLTPADPHHAVVEHEHVERHHDEDGDADLDEDGSLLRRECAFLQAHCTTRSVIPAAQPRLAWRPVSRSSRPVRPRARCCAPPVAARAFLGFLWITGRTLLDSAGTGRRQEAPRQRRQRRNFIRIERAHQARRDQHHQLGALGAVGLALEQVADDRASCSGTECRPRRPASGCRAGRRWRTTGRRAARRVSRPAGSTAPESGSPDSEMPLREVERADFGPHLQPDDVAGNHRLERQPDAEFLVDNGDGVRRPALHDRHRNLAAGEKAGFLAVVGDQIGLGEALEEAARLQRLDDRAAEPSWRLNKNRFRKSLKTVLSSPV